MIAWFEEISIHTSRVFLENVTEKALIEMEKEIEEASLKLKTAAVGVILFGCISGSLIRGTSYNQEVSQKITETGGVRISKR